MALVKQGFANDTSGLHVTIYAPGDATALTPTQATARFCDTLVKALSSNSLHGKYTRSYTENTKANAHESHEGVVCYEEFSF